MSDKVWVELEWEQVDSMIAKELHGHIVFTAAELKGASIHPDDEEYNKKLLDALFVVYDYWTNEASAKKLRQELGV